LDRPGNLPANLLLDGFRVTHDLRVDVSHEREPVAEFLLQLPNVETRGGLQRLEDLHARFDKYGDQRPDGSAGVHEEVDSLRLQKGSKTGILGNEKRLQERRAEQGPRLHSQILDQKQAIHPYTFVQGPAD